MPTIPVAIQKDFFFFVICSWLTQWIWNLQMHRANIRPLDRKLSPMFSLSFPSGDFCRPARHGSLLTVPGFVRARKDSFNARTSSAPQGPTANNIKTAAVTVSPIVREHMGREGQNQLMAGEIRGLA